MTGKVQCKTSPPPRAKSNADGYLLSNPPSYFLSFAYQAPAAFLIPRWGGSTPSSPLSGGCGFGRIQSAETGGECTSSTRMSSPARTRTCKSCGLFSSTRTATQLS